MAKQAKPVRTPAKKPSPAEKKLALRKAKAETISAEAAAQQALAEAEGAGLANTKAQLDLLPDVGTKPVAKGITVGEGVGLVPGLMAHALAAKSADGIAATVGKHLRDSDRVLIVSDPGLASADWVYRSLDADLDLAIEYLNGYVANLAPTVTPPPEEQIDARTMRFGLQRLDRVQATAVMPSIVDAVADAVNPAAQGLRILSSTVGVATDIAGLFIPEYEIGKNEVSVEAAPLLSTLAGRLRGKVKRVGVESFTTLREDSELWKKYRQAVSLRNRLDQITASAEAKAIRDAEPESSSARTATPSGKAEMRSLIEDLLLHADLDKRCRRLLQNAYATLEDEPQAAAAQNAVPGEAAPAEPDPMIAAARKAMESFDEFAKRITAAEPGQWPPIQTAMLHEELRGNGSWTHVLQADLDLTGGETITKKIPLWPPRLRYVAGCNTSYMLYEVGERDVRAAGSFPLSGLMKFRLGLRKPPQPKVIKVVPA